MNRILLLAHVLVVMLACVIEANAYPPQRWDLGLGASGTAMSYTIGVSPQASDDNVGYTGYTVEQLSDLSGVLTLSYRQPGPDWTGESGLYSWELKRPIAEGSSKTWSGIYLWAQNTTLATPYRVYFHIGYRDLDMIPTGYTGHLVLDYVPTECNWTGPTDFWLDLGKRNNFDLPTIVTTDPLKGTKMHLTVYAPVPEPSCLAALGMGITAIGGCAIKRRRA